MRNSALGLGQRKDQNGTHDNRFISNFVRAEPIR
jgi:hypothetical protein